jgi:hypothetical protein
MSEYKNFIQDFPARCGEILESYQKRSTFQGREGSIDDLENYPLAA